MHVRLGLEPQYFARAAELYDVAFGPKFRHVIPDRDRRVKLFAASMDGSRAFAAFADEDDDVDGLLGIAGFHEDGRAFTGAGGLRELLDTLGVLGTIRAVPGLMLFERKPKPGELLMDGICVAAEARGRGVGTALLRAVQAHAGDRPVRLDVIETNPRARALYERCGFVAEQTEQFRILEPLLGFGASTSMVWRSSEAPPANE